MRVLYILSSSSIFGGSTKSFLRMLKDLRKQDIEMHIVCPDDGPAYKKIQKDGYKVFIIPTRFHTYPQWNSLPNCILFIPRLVKHYFINHIALKKICYLCELYHYDIIHTNVSVINVGEKAAKQYGIQHIYHIREYQNLDFGMNMIPTRAKYINYLKQCNSICITKDIRKHYGLTDKNSEVIYDGIKSEDDIYYNDLKEDYFLFVGRVDTNKGFDSVLRTYSEFHKQNLNVKLYVAGMFISPDFEKYTKELILKEGLSDDIIFLGLRNDVDFLMRKAKACIIASPNEAFGLVMVEAMFNGCLTIVYESCGSKEQLNNAALMGMSDIALAYKNEKELIRLMIEVGTNDISTYKNIIEHSQKVVSSLYTIEQNASHVYSYYQKLLKNK